MGAQATGAGGLEQDASHGDGGSSWVLDVVLSCYRMDWKRGVRGRKKSRKTVRNQTSHR